MAHLNNREEVCYCGFDKHQTPVWDFTSGLNDAPDPWMCHECRGGGCPSCEWTGLDQIGPMQISPTKLPTHGPVQIENDEPGVATIDA